MSDNALRVVASEAPELVFLSEILARYVNAHCWYDLRDLPEVERLAEVARIMEWLQELMA